eukprot:scaffold663884_cov57-Prasinocladus_malaysianus.AAC.1
MGRRLVKGMRDWAALTQSCIRGGRHELDCKNPVADPQEVFPYVPIRLTDWFALLRNFYSKILGRKY